MRRDSGLSDAPPRRLGRRASLLLAAGMLSGCSYLSNFFASEKKPIAGKREEVLVVRHGLEPPKGTRPRVVLPPPVLNAAWPEAGGNPAHLMGHLQLAAVPKPAFLVKIGEGGGYRKKIVAQPVVFENRLYTMDSEALVRAFNARTGGQLWSFDTRRKDDLSANVGGGLCAFQGVLYATTGRGDLVALEAASGKVLWRKNLELPIRASPTVADGRLFLITIDQKLYALAAANGRELWTHQAVSVPTLVLDSPGPAYAAGFVFAGFGSGDILALNAVTGDIVWSDSIPALGGRENEVAISAISAMPVTDGERVIVIGQGGLLIADDLHTGRRVWEKEVGGGQTPWVAGEWAFFVTLDQRAAAVNVQTAEVAWVTQLPQYADTKKHKNPVTWYGPVLAGDRLVFAGTNGQALSVSPYNGEILGDEKLPAPAAVAPIVANRMLYFVLDDGRLLALQ